MFLPFFHLNLPAPNSTHSERVQHPRQYRPFPRLDWQVYTSPCCHVNLYATCDIVTCGFSLNQEPEEVRTLLFKHFTSLVHALYKASFCSREICRHALCQLVYCCLGQPLLWPLPFWCLARPAGQIYHCLDLCFHRSLYHYVFHYQENFLIQGSIVFNHLPTCLVIP